MSYDFAVIRPALCAPRADVPNIYAAMCTDIELPAAEGVNELVEELQRRYELNDEGNAGPLVGYTPDARGAVVTTDAESEPDSTAVLLEVARDHGFAVYDPQLLRLYDPRNRVDLAVVVGDGTQIPYVTEHLISELFETLDPDDPFIIIERADEEYIQVYVDPDEPVVVEYRAGGPERHFQATTDDHQLARRVLWGWATDSKDWRDLLTWERLDLD